MSYYIESSDKRNLYIYEHFKNAGINAVLFELNNIKEIQFNKTDTVVLSPAKLMTLDQAKSINNTITIFGGFQHDDVQKYLDEHNILYKNYLLDEEFVVKNAMLTAEGVLAHIISATNKSIFENNILVIGTGRVGRSIIQLLYKLGLKFSIATFHDNKINENLYFGAPIYLKPKMLKNLKNFDVVINTAQFKVFEDEELKYFSKNTTLLEISSADCLNTSLANEFSINFVKLSALPSVYSHQTAAKLMLEFMFRHS